MQRCIENYSEEELKELMPDIPYETIHIVYGYYHKNKRTSILNYCDKCCISKTTLYRYIKQIETIFTKRVH